MSGGDDNDEILALLRQILATLDRTLEDQRVASIKPLTITVWWELGPGTGPGREDCWVAAVMEELSPSVAAATGGMPTLAERAASRGEALAKLATAVVNHDLRQSGRWASGPALGDQGPGA